MRFQFCGNISCPEWFISEISVLTKITAVKMKLIFNQLIAHYLQSSSLSQPTAPEISSKIAKLLNNTGLDIYEMNAVVATLNFILHNSVRFHVSDVVLNKELIDLGLPKENVESITKSYKGQKEKLLQKSIELMYRGDSLVGLQYSIHEFLGSQRLQSKIFKPVKFVEMQIKQQCSPAKDQERSQNGIKQHKFIICEEELDELIFELEQAIAIHDKIQAEK